MTTARARRAPVRGRPGGRAHAGVAARRHDAPDEDGRPTDGAQYHEERERIAYFRVVVGHVTWAVSGAKEHY